MSIVYIVGMQNKCKYKYKYLEVHNQSILQYSDETKLKHTAEYLS